MTDRNTYFSERATVVQKAVQEAISWGRSWSDQWYYSMPPKERELFYGGFKHFSDECTAVYNDIDIRMMTAAPAMYAALKALLETVEASDNDDALVRAAHAAIAKAEGR